MLFNLTNFEMFLLAITAISGFLIVYSHAIFPMILKILRRKIKKPEIIISKRNYISGTHDRDLPEVTIVIPAYNEEDFIAEKITNLAALDYPSDKLEIIVYCDGCTDFTAAAAQGAIYSDLCRDLNVRLIEEENNIGKIAALNKLIPSIQSDIVALSDVSALLSIDSLLVAAAHFQSEKVGFVAGAYDFLEHACTGEETYWRYQRNVKQGESALGGPIGCHGAFYLFRRELFKPLPADTVNDDFILPMEILGQGYKGVYEPDIMALELEKAQSQQDFSRRIRIASGNVQQVFRLLSLLNPKYGGVALSFFSSKALRAFMPVLMMVTLFGSAVLSGSENTYISKVFALGLSAQIILYTLAALKPLFPNHKIINAVHYLVSGHIAGLIGLVRYARGAQKGKWTRAQAAQNSESFAPAAVRFGKRAFDMCAALGGLIILSPLFPVLAILIKLDSAGPVIFKQKRVGMAGPNVTSFFWMYKFRTMVQDAEKMTGAVWAQKNDPRITRMGRFMRKTRLDELPQLWNVLTGDMSIIGPRPERPELYGKLTKEVPFFAERNYGIRPGITGPAQIHNGYDETIEDVRNKAAYDHSYALSLTDFRSWLLNDVLLVVQTVGVVVGRRGQ